MSLQRTYIFTFLLSSRLFMHPYELMSKVCHLCMEQQRLGDPQADKVRAAAASGCGRNIAVGGVVVVGVYESMLRFQKRVRKITPKILQLLTEWTETFPYDFRDERMMRSLKELTHRLASGEEVSLHCKAEQPRRRVSADAVWGSLSAEEERLCCLVLTLSPPHSDETVDMTTVVLFTFNCS